jgi:hypothetical protein
MSGIEAIVINRLIRWAHWKMGSGVSLGYPSMVSFSRLAPGASMHDCSFDSECQETERAVRSLPNDQYRLIRHEYIVSRDWKQHEKAAMLHISPSTYRRWIKEAHHQIAINLNMRCADNAKNYVESFA